MKRDRTHKNGSPPEAARYADLYRRARTGELASLIAVSRRLERRDRRSQRMLAASAGLG